MLVAALPKRKLEKGLAADQLESEEDQDCAAQTAAEQEVEQGPTGSEDRRGRDDGFRNHGELLWFERKSRGVHVEACDSWLLIQARSLPTVAPRT